MHIAFVLIVLTAIAYGSALPYNAEDIDIDDKQQTLDGIDINTAQINDDGKGDSLTLNRSKRATCDIIGGLLNIGDAACGAHCVAKGFRGGWCDGRKVCRCRR